jgi:hypothetical protein
MVTYVVATRREAQVSPSTAEDYVREVPGVWIRGGTDLHANFVQHFLWNLAPSLAPVVTRSRAQLQSMVKKEF